MKILAINPNTSESFNELLRNKAAIYALQSTEIEVISPESGPEVIEGIYDESLSIQKTIETFIDLEKNFDAFIIACFSDHLATYAIREITHKPVLGIAEASIYLASMLGEKFSIITTNDRWKPLLTDAVKKYGVEAKCASIRTIGLSVSDLEERKGESIKKIIENEASIALHQDGAEVICLGCAGMSGFDKELNKKLGIPVLDGFVCAIKLLEVVHQYGLTHSKINTYSQPLYKELTNLPSKFSKVYGKKSKKK